MLSLRPSIFAVILTCVIAAQRVLAAEAGLVSAYSDISHAKCAASGKAIGDDTLVTYRCKPLDDLVLIATYEGTAVRISILRNGDDTGLHLGAGYDVGEKLEWRGWRRDLKFEPAAAILRLIEKTGHNSYASVLTVLRVENGKICPAAWLDVAATPHANAVRVRSRMTQRKNSIAGLTLPASSVRIPNSSRKQSREPNEKFDFLRLHRAI